jgi:hypothetical protein
MDKQTAAKTQQLFSHHEEVVTQAYAAIRDLKILEPAIAARAMAERIIEEAEGEDWLARLQLELGIRFLETAVRNERARVAREAQARLPGFEDLPMRITTSNGQRPLLENAGLTDLRGYLKILNQRNRKRHLADPKIAKIKDLIQRLTDYRAGRSGAHRLARDVTVGELFRSIE